VLSSVDQLAGSLLLLAQVLLIEQVLDVALAAGQRSAVSEAVLPVVLLAVVSAVGTVLTTVGEPGSAGAGTTPRGERTNPTDLMVIFRRAVVTVMPRSDDG
jgi:hypothetical protein